MKFLCERDPLRDALACVVGRTKGSKIPILQHILIASEGKGLIRLTGHDMDSCSQAVVPAEVEIEGAIAVPADRFNPMIAALQSGAQVEVSADDRRAAVKAGNSRYQFSLLPASDFPPALAPQNPTKIQLSAKQVGRLFKTPAPCIMQGKADFQFQGIYLHRVGKRLAACATDRHTFVRVLLDLEPDDFDPVIVPDKSCGEIVRVTGDDDAVLEVSETLLAVDVGHRRFVTKLIDQQFPDYERVVPKPTPQFITVESSEIDAALVRLATTHEGEGQPRVRFHWDDQVETLRASLKSLIASGDEEIECDSPGRPAGEFGAQVELARRLIGCLGGKRTRLCVDASAPQSVRVENPDDPDIVGVLWTCRV